jgi:RNA recognition motif-containing protein
MHIYISNLSSVVNENELKNLFSSFGEVKSAEIVLDVFTGTSRGFAYLEIDDEVAAKKAIAGLHNSLLHELTISVEEAPSKKVQQGSYKIGNGLVDVYRFRKN